MSGNYTPAQEITGGEGRSHTILENDHGFQSKQMWILREMKYINLSPLGVINQSIN